ncbi:hypothetical protein F4777DRAFT_580869 [Nemania sp. FL0916]|nr:hypothetical protein F4777DRAFT_580869 [Nemania sp. FL0916]
MDVDIPGVSTWTEAQKQAFLASPALDVPAGVQSHFGQPVPVSAGLLFFISATIALATIFAGIRIYARVFLVKTITISDALTIISYGLLVGFVYCFYRWALEVGFYVHQWDINFRTFSTYLYLFHIALNLYVILVPTIKAAILLDWVKIFVPKGTRPAFFWVCHVVLWANVIFYIAALILVNLVCKPLEHFWNPLIEGHCSHGRAADVASAAFNTVVDIVILVLPQTIIWKLHMGLERRIGISIIFAIGLVAVVASIVRLVSVVQYIGDTDGTYGGSAFLLWTLAEMLCIFLVLCIPSAPKAIGNSTLVQHATSTLRSLGAALLSSSRRGGSSSDVDRRWPDSPPQERSPGGSYYKISREQIPLGTVDSKGKSVSLSSHHTQRDGISKVDTHNSRKSRSTRGDNAV